MNIMKTKILISIICVCSFFKVQAQEEWEWVCSLVDEQLSKVCTQGADTVYVVGENGLIAQSADKGLTWDKRYFSGKETLNDVIFCNHETGFIAGNNGTILRTQNAGSSWEQMTSGTTLNINAIAAFDLDNIWAIGGTWYPSTMKYSSVIMYSTDMGETWITKPLLSDNLDLLDIRCKGNKGYITGQGGIVLKTENGGRTWEEQILTEYYGIQSLSITENKVYALGDDKIIFTEDNDNWHVLFNTIYSDKAAIYFQDNQKGFVASYDFFTCGDCRMGFMINKTTNGGNTWKEVYLRVFQENTTRSNLSFSPNNELGYCVLGSYLVRTPYTGEFYDCRNYTGMNVVKFENPVLILNQQGDDLQIISHLKEMDRVELFTLDGIRIMQKTGFEQTKTLNINISNLPKGVYLVNILFSDKTNYFSKWIKN